MKTTTSKAQLEVWKMKETVFEKIKMIPKELRIDFILKDTEATINRLKNLKGIAK